MIRVITPLSGGYPTPPPDRYLVYLDELREEGITNMMGARPFLMVEFPELSSADAASILMYWMQTFGVRHGYIEEA